MKLVWTLPVFAGLIAGQAPIAAPALAQGLIAPSRQYLTPKREGLDKSYGLPTFGTPGDTMPKQQATTTQPQQERPPAAPFTGLSTFARPDDKPADTPDFFQKPAGLAAATDSGVPNFFDNTADAERPKVGAKLTGETPVSTTDDGMTTGGDSTADKPRAAPASDD
jgi:hypothetical protein